MKTHSMAVIDATKPLEEALAKQRSEIAPLIEIVEEILEECPRSVDQTTVSKGKTPDECPDYQVITNWSIALTRVRQLEKALADALKIVEEVGK